MPELPEVETVRQGLIPYLIGKKLLKTVCYRENLRYPIPVAALEKLSGETLEAIDRRAKYLLLHFTNNNTLVCHLGMSGHFQVLKDKKTPHYKHTHVIFDFESHHLRYVDPRRFGFIEYYPTTEVTACRHFKKLGPEPFDVTSNDLYRKSRKKSTSIKQFIMDNQNVTGVGNIYANESLFRARVHPMTSCGCLTKKDYAKLIPIIQDVLTAAIAAGGSTIKDHQSPDSTLGYFQHNFQVYGRSGQECMVCGTTICDTVTGNRRTFFCPSCQGDPLTSSTTLAATKKRS